MEPQANVPAPSVQKSNITPSSAETITEDANHHSAGVPVKTDADAGGVQSLVDAVSNTEVAPSTMAKIEA